MRVPAPESRPRVAPVLGALVLVGAALVALGLGAGAQGLRWPGAQDAELLAAVRAPRTLGAWCAGALLGLAGAIAQGLFRNPLADPYLLGSAAGAGLGVVLVLAAGSVVGVGAAAAAGGPAVAAAALAAAAAPWLQATGLVAAAFAGALAGMLLTLTLARGAGRPMLLLLAGVVVGVLLTAAADAVVLFAPQALRARQVFLLGSTSLLGWPEVVAMAAALAATLPAAVALARTLDALALGEATAASLGLRVARWRFVLVMLMALATGTAVAQVGLVAFVGLVAPHIARRLVAATHAPWLVLSTLAGGALLLAADVAARTLVAPLELPVGLMTAGLGGAYLLVLLHRRAGQA